MLPRRPVLPWWLAILVFLPLQVWLFLRLRDAWGVWPTLGAVLVVSLLAARAARPRGLLAWLLPRWAQRRQRARPVWLALLLAGAAAAFLLPWGPQPWLAAFAATSGAKSVLT